MCYLIYKHTFQDGKCYVGMTKRKLEERSQYGWGYMNQEELFAKIREEGWNSMKHEVLETVETEAEARVCEQHYIELYESYKPEKGFNKQGKNKIKEKKIIKCIETGEVFNTCREAGEKVNRTAAAISYAITKKKPCARLHWVYEYVKIPQAS